jgi:acetyl esterase
MPVTPEVKSILDFIAAAQPEGGVPLTPEDMRAAYAALCATESRPEVHRVTDTVAPGPAGDIPVRVYVPTDEPGPRPALVFFHGGGWVIGSVETHDGTARHLALGSGATVVSVDYRLAPEHPFPAAVDDAVAAVRWVVEQAAELGVDPGRVAVGGDSAGGNLAAVVCQQLVAAGGPRLRFQLLVYPVTDGSMSHPSIEENAEGYFLTKDTMVWFVGHYLGSTDAKDPYVSPLHAESLADLPPALVITAEFDPLRDEGEAYAAALREAGVEVEAVRYDGQIHGFLGLAALLEDGMHALDRAGLAVRAALR